MTRETAILIARLSWLLPLAGMVSNAVFAHSGGSGAPQSAYEQGQAEGRACALSLAYVAGAILAVVALRAVKQHGPAGIRLLAWIGLALSVIPLLVMIVTLILAMRQNS